MKPWNNVRIADLKKIKGVCLDIDDTLSTHGKLTAEAYSALWALQKKGFYVMPITGRPAGWCDHIARFWPVNAVIVENGASVFYMKEGRRLRLDTPGAPLDRQKKLEKLKTKIILEFPNAEFASDQGYREYDLAIDFCEAVRPWKKSEVNRLRDFCEAQGAHAKISSIHVNTWFGQYDKWTGFQNWIKNGKLPKELKNLESWIFIGDSPNDEPLFEKFKISVGVANLKNFASELKNPPTYLTEKESGGGFSEMALKLLNSRRV